MHFIQKMIKARQKSLKFFDNFTNNVYKIFEKLYDESSSCKKT